MAIIEERLENGKWVPVSEETRVTMTGIGGGMSSEQSLHEYGNTGGGKKKGTTAFERFRERRRQAKEQAAQDKKLYDAVYETESRNARIRSVAERARADAQAKASAPKSRFGGLSNAFGSVGGALGNVSNAINDTGLGGVVARGGFLGDEFREEEPIAKRGRESGLGGSSAFNDLFTVQRSGGHGDVDLFGDPFASSNSAPRRKSHRRRKTSRGSKKKGKK